MTIDQTERHIGVETALMLLQTRPVTITRYRGNDNRTTFRAIELKAWPPYSIGTDVQGNTGCRNELSGANELSMEHGG